MSGASAPRAGAPSPFVLAWLDAAVGAAGLGPVLDVACGRGRHALAIAARGARAVGVDRAGEALRALAGEARARALPLACVRADLEGGGGLPFAAGRFGALIVSRYLWRPLARDLAAALAPGGLLLYETFLRTRAKVVHAPRNPAFLLEPGELPGLFPGLHVERYEEGLVEGDGGPVALARLAARRPRS